MGARPPPPPSKSGLRHAWLDVLVSVVAVALLGPAKVHAFTVSCEQTVRVGTEESKAKVVIKDWMFRLERTHSGKSSVTVRNASGLFTYYPDEGIATRISAMDASQQRFLDNAANYPEYLRKHRARLIAEESVRDYPCEVYLLEDRAIGGAVKVWLWKEEHFPVRLQVLSGRGKVTVDLNNIQIGVRAPESLFELPMDVQIQAGVMHQVSQFRHQRPLAV
jgi:outer membrane lipoprotein-sorting protein